MTNYLPKICIAAICKNEERFIKFFINELLKLGFEDFIFVDTGSTDKTIDIIQSFESENIKLFTEKFSNEASFDDFRNIMWTKVLENSNSDYVLVLDIDELLINTSHAEISKFLQTNSGKAFSLNRKDICDGDVSSLKRLLKRENGIWNNSVHEHFTFDKDDDLNESKFEIIHLSTERIRSKNKLEKYKSLVDFEYSTNKKIDYLYFKIIDAFASCNKFEMLKLFDEFKNSKEPKNNFFSELILFTFLKFSILLNNEQMKNEIIVFARNINFPLLILEAKCQKFIEQINKQNETNVKFNFDFISQLGQEITFIQSFSNVKDITYLNQYYESLVNTFSEFIESNKLIDEMNGKIKISIQIKNDIAFFQHFFGGFFRQERINLTKYCLLNDIERQTYYEQ